MRDQFTQNMMFRIKYMRMHYVLTAILLLGIMHSCKEATKEEKELDKMYDEVMLIHDEVMPEMSTINRLSRSLKADVDEITDLSEKDAYLNMIKELQVADDGMMDWMSKFKKPKLDDIEKAKAYYLEQKEAITDVKYKMETSIEKARKMVK